uniref:Core shell protein Gag P30 domain-containing protein n=1 Tax=Rousettus aegyptiacus TaxID=9407 RepID=A0A7J8JGQ4_ROUAE|nr:hypothetical protein HJG63_010203 [Rousettus aegyptiacus]
MVYVPFLTSDLYNWKAQNLPFSEKPQALMRLLESVFQTHRPTQDDCQQLLVTLFTAEERGRIWGIWTEAQKIVAGVRGVEEALEQIEEEFPSTRPDWGHNSQAGRTSLDRHHQILIGGIRMAACQPTNLSKVTEVIQGPQESPGAFLERLQEAYRLYNPINPEAPENQRAINVVFATQAAPDIQLKLQKLEGFAGMNLPQLVEIAQKMFNNREAPHDPKRMAKIMVAAIQEERSGKTRA